MPFTNTGSFTFPPNLADVQILFSGLLLLYPTGSDCSVGALNAAGHKLSFAITERGTGQPVPLPAPIKPPLTIRVSTSRGVTKFVSSSVRPFPGSERDDKRDLRWAVDLKGLHVSATPSTALVPAATLKDGVIFTAAITDPLKLAVKVQNPSVPDLKDWNRIGAEIGANIYLQGSDKLLLDWTDSQGIVRNLTLPQATTSGGGYLISIDNGPIDSSVHDDFDLYYDGVSGVTGPQRFHLLFFNVHPTRANVDAPCMSGVLDGDGRNGN